MSALGDKLRSRLVGEVVRSAPVAAPFLQEVPDLEFTFQVDPSPVGSSEDLKRILALPRRSPKPPTGLAGRLTDELRRPGGTMTLWDEQAFALEELRTCGGLIGAIGVGFGKGLISLLAPTVLSSRVAVILVPAALKKQTVEKFYPMYAPHFRIHNLHGHSKHYQDVEGIIHVVSYSALSSARGADLLDTLQPDLIVLDEAHFVSHTTAARTKRFRRFCFKARNDGRLRHIAALSGTFLSKRLEDAAGLSKLVLRELSPFPADFHTLQSWAEALNPSEDGDERDPGELRRLCRDANEPTRSGFRRRLVETPGVVATSESSVSTSLVFHERSVAVPPEVSKALKEMEDAWVTPGGEELTDALSLWRHARELATGCYLEWTWPRNEPKPLRDEWLDTRRNWHREIRDFLKHRAAPGMDSPLFLARAAASGRWPSQFYAPWSDIHKKCRPKTVCRWISDFLVNDVVEWGKTPGIIWTEVKELAHEIARVGGFPYYGAEDESPGDVLDEKGNRTIVLSLASRKEGLNLQMFHRNLLTTIPSNGKACEQFIARTHRPGQTADQVDVYVYRHGPFAAALRSAIKDAQFVHETLGSRQRLLYADYGFTP